MHLFTWDFKYILVIQSRTLCRTTTHCSHKAALHITITRLFNDQNETASVRFGDSLLHCGVLWLENNKSFPFSWRRIIFSS